MSNYNKNDDNVRTNNKIMTFMKCLFVSLLTIAFIVLKLCNVIDWSWWWVLSPLWIYVALNIATLIIIVIILVIKDLIKGRRL